MKEYIKSFMYKGAELPFEITIAGISYCDGTYKITRPNSQICCMEYILEGEGCVKLNNKVFYPKQGDLYILPMNCDHEYYSDADNPWIKIWFNIKGELVENLFKVYNLESVNHIEGLDLSHLFFKFLKEAKREDDEKDIFYRNSLIFHEILQNIHIHLNINCKIKTEADYLKEYIDKNITRKITLDELAGIIYRSVSQTIRIFKKEFSVTPYEYILTKKSEHATNLIVNTNISIKEIAYMLNFVDEHYFSNYFKKRYGVSPKEYRKSHRKQ